MAEIKNLALKKGREALSGAGCSIRIGVIIYLGGISKCYLVGH